METTGEAEEGKAKEQLVMVIIIIIIIIIYLPPLPWSMEEEMREAGFNWQQLKRQSQDRERWRDFLKDPQLYAPYGVKGFKSSSQVISYQWSIGGVCGIKP